MTASDNIHSLLSFDAWALILLLFIPSFAVNVYRPPSGAAVSGERVVSQSVTSTTSTPFASSLPLPKSTPRYRNGTWSKQYGIPGTPPNQWWLIDYWDTWIYNGSFTAVANSFTGLSYEDDVLILPFNVAYGSSTNFQWLQFDIDFAGDGTIWWGIWNVDCPNPGDSNYHPHTIGLTYVVGHSYRYQGSLVSDKFRFQVWDDTAATNWYIDLDIPSTSQYSDSSCFSPASALEGYTTPLTVGNVPLYQFTIGYGMTSFIFGQFGYGLPNGLSIDQQSLGGTPTTWHWEIISLYYSRGFRVYSLPMSYLGEDPESVESNDLHASVRIDYTYLGQSGTIVSNTPFDFSADIGSSVVFTVMSAPPGWSFGNKWDHYGYAQHDATIFMITAVSGSGTDKVAAFFNGVPVQITVTSSPTGSGFVTVDSSPITAPQVFTWLFSSSHSIAANSPVSGGTGIQYVWVSWSDSGIQSHSITVPSSATTYTATFKKQYLLTVSVNPTAGGNLSVGSGWQDSGSTVQVSAAANSGYSFYYWSLDGVNMGSSLSFSVLMNSPHSLTVYFRGTSSLSIGLSSGSILLGAPVTLSGMITPAQSSPGIPAGTTVLLSYSLDGTTWITLIMTQTAGGGAYSVVWYSPYPGSYQIRAAWNGNSDYQGSTSSTVALAVTGPLPRITLLIAGPSSVAKGGSATFDVMVDNSGSATNATLYFEVTGPGGYWYFDTQQVAVAAGGRGRFQFLWQIPSTVSSGQYQVFVGVIPPKTTALAQTQITVT
jgi:hypothetical protein